jgi:formate dehydrogenase maturation protein FdhE
MEMGVTSEYNEELISCPFCGGEASLTHVEFNDGDIWYNPNCEVCNGGWNENYETKEEAVKAWNKRR